MKLLAPSLTVIILAVVLVYSSQREPVAEPEPEAVGGTLDVQLDAETKLKLEDDLAVKQEEVLQKYGKLVSKSRESQPNIGGTPVSDLDTLAIPNNVEIYTYESNAGNTYQIVTYEGDTITSKAYGDDPVIVASKTYVITGLVYDDKSASSTHEIP